MKSTLTVALVLTAAASFARAEATLDAVGGTLYVTSIDGAHATDRILTADKNEVAIEVVSQAANALPIRRISHSRAGLAVHSGLGGTAPLTTALFRYGTAEASYTATAVLRDPRTGSITKPSAVRTIVLDPNDPGATLIDAGHLQLPDGTVRAWVLARRSSGEALVIDYDVAGGAVHRDGLGFTAPLGSNKGSVVVGPDGRAWVLVVTANGFVMQEVTLTFENVVGPPRALTVGAGFDPESTRLGIIAILIGLLAQPAPAVSYQVGDEIRLATVDGTGFRTVVRQPVPPDAKGLIESEGIGYAFLLPYIEQDNVYRSVITGEPIAVYVH